MTAENGFLQDPPQLANQYADDALLRSHLRRVIPADVLAEIEPQLEHMGAQAAGPLWELALRHRRQEPEHVPFDAWGRRVDEVRVNPAWEHYARVAAEEGLVATGYERRHGRFSRLHQFALVYLFDRSSQVYTCPLAMTDGCARTLEVLAPAALRDRVLPRLVSRDPDRAWTSGQWMTERTGGSDVGLSETVARRTDRGWALSGVKWFTSAVTSQVALTLARPEGNGPGGKGLALFFVELRDAAGRLQNIEVLRLKEKLGTRNLPTAELRLSNTPAELLGGPSDGVRNMGTMLNLTRTWNACSSAATVRRGLALARDYARRRVAFGAPLAEKPLHLDTLADLAADQQATFLLAFHLVEQIGREETGELDAAGEAVLRLLTPLVKLATARWAVAGASETLEAFGGAGYVEDTGLPELLRDGQVLPIWEGTTNVLALEVYRAIVRADALRPFAEDLRARLAIATDGRLRPVVDAAQAALGQAEAWWAGAAKRDPRVHEAGARRFAFVLARALALALGAEHAQWALEHDKDGAPAEAVRRLAARPLAAPSEPDDPEAVARLARGERLPPA